MFCCSGPIMGHIKRAASINTIFCTAGPSAGKKKCLAELSNPANKAAIPIKRMNGNIILVRPMAKSSFSGFFKNPMVKKRTIRGLNNIPIMDTTNNMQKKVTSSPPANSLTFFGGFVFSHLVKTGITPALKAPSAKRRLKVDGILSAAKKASVTHGSNMVRTKTSLIKPSIRLKITANPITAAPLVISGFPDFFNSLLLSDSIYNTLQV